MAIVSSGQLALSAIRDEFGAGTTSNVSLRTLSAAAGLSVPDGFNEFYGLSAFTPPSVINNGGGTVTGGGTAANPYVITQGSGSFSVDSGYIDGNFSGDPLYHFMEYLHWNYNYYTGAIPGLRVQFRANEAAQTKIYLKYTAKSISGFGTAADTFFTYITAFRWYTWGSNGPVLNQVIDGQGNMSVNQEFEIRIGASHVSEQYFFTDETYSDYTYYSYGGGYPTINSLTYQVWFEKV